MSISHVFLILFLWALMFFTGCFLIEHRYNQVKILPLLAETLTLSSALFGGVVIYHLFSEREEVLSQASYKNNLIFAYETSLYCGRSPASQYSPAVLDSCAIVDGAFKQSSAPMIEHDPEYWQRSMDRVVAQLKAISNRQPPRDSFTSPIDKEEIALAIKSLHPGEQYKPNSILLSWNERFIGAYIIALVVIGAATIKFYMALTKRYPEMMSALMYYMVSLWNKFKTSRSKS